MNSFVNMSYTLPHTWCHNHNQLRSKELHGGTNSNLPLHHEHPRAMLVHRAAKFKLAGEAHSVPVALQTNQSLPCALAKYFPMRTQTTSNLSILASLVVIYPIQVFPWVPACTACAIKVFVWIGSYGHDCILAVTAPLSIYNILKYSYHMIWRIIIYYNMYICSVCICMQICYL